MFSLNDTERQNINAVKQQSGKIVDEISMEAFNFSDFKTLVARLYTMVANLKKSIAGIFKVKEASNITSHDKQNLKWVDEFQTDKKFNSLVESGIDLTKVTVYVPRHMVGKASPLINSLKDFFNSYPAKFVEELKEANKILATLINEPEARTSTRVKEMLSLTLTTQTETFLKTFSAMQDIRHTDVEKDFFDVYDSLNEFKAIGAVIEEVVPVAFDKVPKAILEELDAFSDGMTIFVNLIKAGEEGSVSPEVIKQSAIACDKFVEAAELYAVTMYRLKEFLTAYANTCQDKFKKVK